MTRCPSITLLTVSWGLMRLCCCAVAGDMRPKMAPIVRRDISLFMEKKGSWGGKGIMNSGRGDHAATFGSNATKNATHDPHRELMTQQVRKNSRRPNQRNLSL